MGEYVLTMDVWPELKKLLNLPDMAISGGVTIHLKQGDVVRVDALGIMPKTQAVDVTTMEQDVTEHANCS